MTESIGAAVATFLIEVPALPLGLGRQLLPLLALAPDPPDGRYRVWAVGAVDARSTGPVWRCFDRGLGIRAVPEDTAKLPTWLARLSEEARSELGRAAVEPCFEGPDGRGRGLTRPRVRLFRVLWLPGEAPERQGLLGEPILS